MQIETKRTSVGRVADIARRFNMPWSTVKDIIKDKERYHDVAKQTHGSIKMVKLRNANLITIETRLLKWFKSKREEDADISSEAIRKKALSIFAEVKKEDPTCTLEFKASVGWFTRFQKRTGIKLSIRHGEAASADKFAANAYRETFKTLVEGYSPFQVFNFDETGINWKKMPKQTYIMQDEKKVPGHKASKERFTLLVGSNANGDFKMRPLLIYNYENPRALKNVSKTDLPVIFRSNRKAWITRELFEDWLLHSFTPAVERYLKNKNLAKKIILFVDNATSHNLCPENVPDFINLQFLPPNTTSLIQPMDQQVIANLKAKYHKYMYQQCFQATDGERKVTLKEFWKAYNIHDAIVNIGKAWKNVSEKSLSAAWRNLWPEIASEFKPVEEQNDEIAEVIQLGQNLGLEVSFDDVIDLIKSHDEELNSSAEDSSESEEEIAAEPEVGKELTIPVLKEIIEHARKIKTLLSLHDPQEDRVIKASLGINMHIEPYEFMLKEMSKPKQTTIDSFFKHTVVPTSSSLENPTPSTSGSHTDCGV